jgi:phenylalanyl-tRNA synthetase beta chain
MICNAEEGMCIAGVFGGIGSGVSIDTTEIFLESAYFNPVSIRQTSKYHNLKTDASFRFERGADPQITIYALKRAATLLKEICGAVVSSEIIDVYPKPVINQEVFLRHERLKLLTGTDIPKSKVVKILTDLGFEILKQDDSGILLKVPTFKVDVIREADVIEEVLRIYGYNKVEISGQILS